MTGYDEATTWLRDNAPEWLIARAHTTLKAGVTVGAPTTLDVEVELIESDAVLKQSLSRGYVTLNGEGTSILEAVQNAVGGLR